MSAEATKRLQRAALDRGFAEWMRSAVQRFVAGYDFWDAAISREIMRQYENVYEEFVVKHFQTDDGPNWVGDSPTDVEHELRLEFEKSDKFRNAASWSKNGSCCLSCGCDISGTPIDMQTLTEDARQTLVALYLMSLGDSVLLVSKPPDWKDWRDSCDEIQRGIAWIVSELDQAPHDRFGRIGLLIEWVLNEWNELPFKVKSSLGDNGKEPKSGAPTVPEKSDLSGVVDGGELPSVDDHLARWLTKQQWLVIKHLRNSQHRVRFATLKEIPGAFRKGEETNDRAVEALFERASGLLADANLEVKTEESKDGERWAWLVEVNPKE